MTAEKYPRRHPNTAFRPMGDEGGVVVLPTQREVKVLNPVGIRIYGLLDGQHTHEQIVDTIVSEFDVTREQAQADVREFLTELDAHGMLSNDGEASTS